MYCSSNRATLRLVGPPRYIKIFVHPARRIYYLRGLASSRWSSVSRFRNFRLQRILAMHSLAGSFARAPIGFLFPQWVLGRFSQALSAGVIRGCFDAELHAPPGPR